MALTDEAILRIKAMIVSGQLQPGQRLPPESALAEQLGLSRNSMREAVRALALINILDVRQGDGTYVTSLEPELLLDALTFVVEFHRDESVLEFLRVRRILEPAAASMAALVIGAGELAALEANLEASSPDADPEDLIKLDIEFHHLIGVASGNQVLASLIEGLSGPTNRARAWRGRMQPGSSQRTVNEHRAILEALAAREPELAHAAMVNHVAGVENWLRLTR
jgi:GntR family transcriptional regulator, transcriptional repressor for pyruvate dehydrogenase complex